MRSRSTKLRVVRATLADIDHIAPLFLSYLDFYRQRAPVTRARAFLRDRLKRMESVIFFARLGGRAVGFVQLYPTFASLELRRSWVLSDLFVAPAARRHGVAQALLARARQLAAATKAEGMTLETAQSNRPAQRLYEQLGWRRDEQFYRYHLPVRRRK